jgi:hypothetical protein
MLWRNLEMEWDERGNGGRTEDEGDEIDMSRRLNAV